MTTDSLSFTQCIPRKPTRRNGKRKGPRHSFRQLGNVVDDLALAGRGLRNITLASLKKYCDALPAVPQDSKANKENPFESKKWDSPPATKKHSPYMATPTASVISLILPGTPSRLANQQLSNNMSVGKPKQGSLEDVTSPRHSIPWSSVDGLKHPSMVSPRFKAQIIPWSSLSSTSHPKTRRRAADKRTERILKKKMSPQAHVTFNKTPKVTIVPVDDPSRKMKVEECSVVSELMRFVNGKPANYGDVFHDHEDISSCPEEITFTDCPVSNESHGVAWDHHCEVSHAFVSPTTRVKKHFSFSDDDTDDIKSDTKSPTSTVSLTSPRPSLAQMTIAVPSAIDVAVSRNKKRFRSSYMRGSPLCSPTSPAA